MIRLKCIFKKLMERSDKKLDYSFYLEVLEVSESNLMVAIRGVEPSSDQDHLLATLLYAPLKE